MNSKPKETTTTQSSKTDAQRTPLAEQAPIFSDIWRRTGEAVSGTPEQWITPATGMQTDAVQQLAGIAPSLGANAGSLRDMAGKVSSGFFLDPSNDPTFAGAAQAAINPITRTLREQILPGITDASIRNAGTGGGPAAYGGARQDIQENRAVQDWSNMAGDITSKMANASREAGLKLLPQAGAMDAAATAAALTPANTLGQAGTQQQVYNQQEIDNATKAWLAALQGGQAGANILNTGGFGNQSQQSSGTSTTVGPAPDMATQWLQGLTGGAGMLNSLGGLMGGSGVGSWLGGAGGAAGIGDLLAAGPGLGALMLSDRRVKTAIRKLRTLANGLSWYAFRYVFSPYMEEGLMAQEVERFRPEAVMTSAGLRYVNYALAMRS